MATVCVILLGAGCVEDTAEGPPDPSSGPPASWSELTRIVASSPVQGDQFGYAIALSGDGSTLAVGAPMNSSAARGVLNTNQAPVDDAVYSSGAVYVFGRVGDDWVQQGFIKASNRGSNDQFGSAVALSDDGDMLAVSAPFEDSAAQGINADQADNSVEQSGAVYVFRRAGGGWSQEAYVKASNTGELIDGDTFGYTIALSRDGSTLAVGAPGEDSVASGVNGDQADNSAMGAGAVYVFRSEAQGWLQQAYVKSSQSRANVLFGYSVALDGTGDNLAIGAYDESRGHGAVYVFGRDGDLWAESNRLEASNGEAGDSMGAWIAMSADGGTLAAGAPDEDSLLIGVNSPEAAGSDQATDTSAGAAYVFSRTNGAWTQQSFIKASNPGPGDWFGVRLALSGDGETLAVGAPNQSRAPEGRAGGNGDSRPQAGAVYVYSRIGSDWISAGDLESSNTQEFDEFGSALALSRDGRMIAVGGRFEDSGPAVEDLDETGNWVRDSGAVYVFVR